MKTIANSIFKTFFLSLCIIANVSFSYAQTASILPPAKTQLLDNNGKPLVQGTVDYYVPGTTTRKTTWQNSGQTIANANPVVLDSAGRALMLGDGSYRQVVKDRLGNVIWDQVTSSTGSGGGGSTATVGDGQPVGSIQLWAGMVAPAAYAFAYGQEFVRASFPELFAAVTSQQNVSCTLGNPTLTGLSDTQNLPIGAHIESACLSAGATIVSKTSSTVVASTNAILSSSTTVRFFPYGNGDGSATFNVPDMRGKVPVGRCNMGGIDCTNLNATYYGTIPIAVGANGGNQSTTLATANFPPYTPTGSVPIVNTLTTASVVNIFPTVTSGSPTVTGYAGGSGTNLLSGSVTASFNGVAQGGTSTPFGNIQPSITTNYVIKTTPDTNPNSYFGVASIGGMTGVLLCGNGVTCAGNTISVTSAVPSVTVGTTIVGNSTNGALLYANSGILAEYTTLPASLVGTNTLTNSKLDQAGAATFKGNPSNSTANVTDFTIQGLIARGIPDGANDKLPIFDDIAGTIKYVTPNQIAASGVAGVSSFGGATGAILVGSGLSMAGNTLSSISSNMLYGQTFISTSAGGL